MVAISRWNGRAPLHHSAAFTRRSIKVKPSSDAHAADSAATRFGRTSHSAYILTRFARSALIDLVDCLYLYANALRR